MGFTFPKDLSSSIDFLFQSAMFMYKKVPFIIILEKLLLFSVGLLVVEGPDFEKNELH
jgi:hypothetical protein